MRILQHHISHHKHSSPVGSDAGGAALNLRKEREDGSAFVLQEKTAVLTNIVVIPKTRKDWPLVRQWAWG